jgi:ABC-type transporter Mla subunit MlaD
MARPLHWRTLGGGIIACLGLLGVVLATFAFAKIGGLRGDKADLYITAPEARDIIEGTEVWVGGQRVGAVASIAFQSSAVPLDERVVIRAKVLERELGQIRRDARASFRTGATYIGARVVAIGIGSAGAPAVADGDTIRTAKRPDVVATLDSVKLVTAGIPAILENISATGRNARTVGRRVAALGADGGPLDRIRTTMGAISKRHEDARGTLPLLVAAGPDLRARSARLLSAGDSVRQMIAMGRASLGRFRADTSLFAAVDRLRADVAEVRRLASSPVGTLGRLKADSALIFALDSVHIELRGLLTDMKAHPLRYIVF